MTFQPADIPVLADAFPSGCHMKTMARLPVCAALPVCTQAMAQQTALKIDPAPSHSSGARFEIATDATSGESGNESRDRRMHREIPESAKYPEIVFRPDQVDGKLAPQGASQVKLHGRFEIHTAEHEITVPVDVQAANGKYQGDGALRRSLRAVGYEKPEHVHSARRQEHRNHSARSTVEAGHGTTGLPACRLEFLHFPAIFDPSTHYMWGRRFRLPTRYVLPQKASPLASRSHRGNIPVCRLAFGRLQPRAGAGGSGRYQAAREMHPRSIESGGTAPGYRRRYAAKRSRLARKQPEKVEVEQRAKTTEVL